MFAVFLVYSVLKVCEQLVEKTSYGSEQGSSQGSNHSKKGPGATIRLCMLSLLRVLLNITHDNGKFCLYACQGGNPKD